MNWLHRLYVLVQIRLHWVEAYLAHHRQDLDAFIQHEYLMRCYERELELLDFQRRFQS